MKVTLQFKPGFKMLYSALFGQMKINKVSDAQAVFERKAAPSLTQDSALRFLPKQQNVFIWILSASVSKSGDQPWP
jgi:hypothetical protein